MVYQTQALSRHLAASLSLLALGHSLPAMAQEDDPQQLEESDPNIAEHSSEDDLHNRKVDQRGVIVVTGTSLREFDLLAGVSVLETAALDANMDGQLGEVLASVPGVAASGFAPGASRPILRGFSGERVKVLVDGIGAIDVSNTSADHAVSIDPLTAESIEVLRGPAVLLYGSQAIGGAVNVIDKRIPRRVPNEHLHVDALVRADTVSDLREGGASFDLPLGGGFVAHVDGSYRTSDDLEVPGYLVAPGLRAELLEEAEEEAGEGHLDEAEELRELALQQDYLRNSGTETWTANAGMAFFRNESSLGVSVGIYDTFYGIPIRPGAGHAHGEEEGGDVEIEEEGPETVSIGLRQYRADMRGDVRLGNGFFERLKLRVGYSDYTHTEFEGVEVGTVFDVQGVEARAELVQNENGNLRGSIGTQYYFRDFLAQGAEAYVAPNRTAQISFFALEEYDLGSLSLEGALRYENTKVDSVPLGLERDFGGFSGAIGLAYEIDPRVRAGVNFSRVSRAPSAEELFSEGPHIATQAFEIGDPDLTMERAWGAEAFLRGVTGPFEFNLAAYRNWFDDYVYLSETGDEEDGLPVFVYLQQDATYSGLEGEFVWHFIESDGLDVSVDLRGEYVEAQLADGTPVPRIPPLSLLGALEADTGDFDFRGEVEWFGAQRDVAPFETETEGYTFVNAVATWRPFRGDPTVTLILKAENIFDTEGRRHASFTKDYVPLPGRNFSLALRASL